MNTEIRPFSRWKPLFIEARTVEVVSGDNWGYKTCKAPVKSSPPTNQHPVFVSSTGLSFSSRTEFWFVFICHVFQQSLQVGRGKPDQNVSRLLKPSLPQATDIPLHWNGYWHPGYIHIVNYCFLDLVSTDPVLTDPENFINIHMIH